MMFRALILAAALSMLVAGAGCKGGNDQASAPAGEKQPVTVQADAAAPATPAAPAAPAEPAAQAPPIRGKVVETMDAAGYTYVNVETATGSVWAAIPESTVEVGKEITLAGGMEMKNFESKTLGRTFDSVIFSSGVLPMGGDTAPPTAAADAPPAAGGDSFAAAMQEEAGQQPAMGNAPASGGSAAAIVPSNEVKVEKAEGQNAYTVGELYAKKGELNGQTVQVRGKVVKVSKMIMGKNWLHLQDGTGDPNTSSHDLVVTTMAEAEKDAVVVVEGALHADKDFGSGYRYDVIIEDAQVK